MVIVVVVLLKFRERNEKKKKTFFLTSCEVIVKHMYLHDFACHAQCTYACEKETRKSTEAIVRAGICHAGATVVSSNRMKYMPCFTA